jgi:hypothetical protein
MSAMLMETKIRDVADTKFFVRFKMSSSGLKHILFPDNIIPCPLGLSCCYFETTFFDSVIFSWELSQCFKELSAGRRFSGLHCLHLCCFATKSQVVSLMVANLRCSHLPFCCWTQWWPQMSAISIYFRCELYKDTTVLIFCRQIIFFFQNFDLSLRTLQSEQEVTFDSQMRMCLGTWEVCLTVQLTTLALRCAKLYNKCQNLWSKLAIDLPCQRIVLNCRCMLTDRQTDRSAALTSPLVGHSHCVMPLFYGLRCKIVLKNLAVA